MNRPAGDPSTQSADGAGLAPGAFRLAVNGSQTVEIFVDVDSTDEITKAIVAKSYQIPAHYQLALDLTPANGRILDLGAHLGTFSLFAAFHGRQVISVEASPRNVALFQASKSRNGLDGIRIVPAAVSDHTGWLEFIEWGPYGAVANRIIGKKKGQSLSVRVPAVTVDSLLVDSGWEHVDFIKMDIEGSEIAALQGMNRLLSRADAPGILFESNGHALDFFGGSPQRLLAILEESGYQCFHFFNATLFPISAQDLQLECVADCLALKKPLADLQTRFSIAPPMTSENRLELALASLADANPDVRAYIGRVLEGAGQAFLADARVISALNAIKHDPVPAVRAAAVWWQEKDLAVGRSERLPRRLVRRFRDRFQKQRAVRVIRTLDELDNMLLRLDAANKISDDELRGLFPTFRMDFSRRIPEDPYSPEYAKSQFDLYERISGKPYALENEKSVFDVDAAVARPFPYYTGSGQTVGYHLAAIAHLIQLMKLGPRARIVEFGPGWGNTTLFLAMMGFEITAVDVDKNFCDLITRRAQRAGVEINVVNADFSWIEKITEPVDAILFFESFHHASDHLGLIAALERAVKRDGRVYFAAEPITTDFPIPWGLRLDGEALWAIRNFGWLELGFSEKYFTKTLQKFGWAVRKHTTQATPWGTVFEATRLTR